MNTETISKYFKEDSLRIFFKGISNSYSQIFFSTNRLFAAIVLVVTFFDVYAGLFGLLAVVTTQIFAFALNFDKNIVARGLYGFNSLLVALGLGIYFEASPYLAVIVILAALLTLFISVMLQGVLGKYALPYLSLPFILAFWIFFLASRNFPALGISERGIYTFNDLYTIGGDTLVRLYEWFNGITIVSSVKVYFISLSAILFQYNVLSGIILAAGLLVFSRIAFTLSLLGFYTAYLFYMLVGASITEADYSYIGFNYILTAIAVGGFFIIPSRLSYLWVVVLIPVVAIITTSLNALFAVFRLPVYSLPFNMIVLLFLYILKFRQKFSPRLAEVYIQQDSPERNFYSFQNHISRFRYDYYENIKLPFMGKWSVSQGHEGEHTHKDRWKHAWDFVIFDNQGNQYRNEGNIPEDYYCFNKPVTAPADGEVVEVVGDIHDNAVGDVNLKDNWGNTIIIMHGQHLYSKLSHLKEESINVKKGDKVKCGQILARCGNSGRSPYPHLHFQLQPFPYIGSETIDYPLSNYIRYEDEGFEYCSYASPEKDDTVSNIEPTPLLKNAFNLIPGQSLCFEVSYGNETHQVQWEVMVNAYNKSYIRCDKSGATAYFENDGDLFYFTHYKGKRNALLYYFYLACYKVPAGFYQDLEIRDDYPLNAVQRKWILWIQDLLAPFHVFMRSRFAINCYHIDDPLSPSKIRLLSSSENLIMNNPAGNNQFMIDIGGKGIELLTIHTNAKQKQVRKCQEQ
ncbi:MAG: urea transporter [Bacteroidales bacterium]|nr:urea transporter [Bacteroidales bacterium]